MNTPIADFVKNYINSGASRLHMPGHKGVSVLGCENYDITEVKGADELFAPQSIILQSEKNARDIFGTGLTVYSAGGSSQSINAMLYLASLNNGGSRYILAGRNAHKAFIYAAAKIGLDVKWIYPERSESICRCAVTPETLKKELRECSVKPVAVYITSPDYLGGVSDIQGLSEVCRSQNVPLLVDNAHGAYTAFLKKSLHPIHLGADMCCDSAHKTLPVLTGGGYLHINKSDRFRFSENAVKAMEIFGSTSPSYLILQSLDLCNKYLYENVRSDLARCAEKVLQIRSDMKKSGIGDISNEPLKITADFSQFEVSDGGFSEHFRKMGVEPEYTDDDFAVFMFSPFNSDADFEKLQNAFCNLSLKPKCSHSQVRIIKSKSAVSIRDAVFSPFEIIEAEKSEGRICAAPTVSCPPAVPVVISGEVIEKGHIELMKKYRISQIAVLK